MAFCHFFFIIKFFHYVSSHHSVLCWFLPDFSVVFRPFLFRLCFLSWFCFCFLSGVSSRFVAPFLGGFFCSETSQNIVFCNSQKTNHSQEKIKIETSQNVEFSHSDSGGSSAKEQQNSLTARPLHSTLAPPSRTPTTALTLRCVPGPFNRIAVP
jgi:hypothetical protein